MAAAIGKVISGTTHSELSECFQSKQQQNGGDRGFPDLLKKDSQQLGNVHG